MSRERIRQLLLIPLGVLALVYALWPPLEFEYLGVAAGLLGIEPLAQGYQKANSEEAA